MTAMDYIIIYIIGICTGCAIMMGWIMYEDWKDTHGK